MTSKSVTRIIGVLCTGVTTAAHAQNLIPDPGFEQYMFGCDQGLQLSDLTYWDRIIGGNYPEYYHTCNVANGLPELGVPVNLNGYEAAHGGNAYCGLMTYDLGTQYGNPKDYINTPLTEPLEAGVEYCFQAWLSRADTSHCATGLLQGWLATGDTPNLFAEPDDAWFSDAPINVSTFQVASVGWTMVETTFTAAGGENNLTIGSFAYSEQIDTVILVNDFPYGAYYYIDDVYLGSCADIGWSEQNGQSFSLALYPTPALQGGDVQVSVGGANRQCCTLSVFDLAGRCVLTDVLPNGQGVLHTASLAQGNYVVTAATAGRLFSKRLVIQ